MKRSAAIAALAALISLGFAGAASADDGKTPPAPSSLIATTYGRGAQSSLTVNGNGGNDQLRVHVDRR